MLICSSNGLYIYNYSTHKVRKLKLQTDIAGREAMVPIGKTTNENKLYLQHSDDIYTLNNLLELTRIKQLKSRKGINLKQISDNNEFYYINELQQLIGVNLTNLKERIIHQFIYQPLKVIINAESELQYLIATEKEVILKNKGSNDEKILSINGKSKSSLEDISLDNKGNYWLAGNELLLVYNTVKNTLINKYPEIIEKNPTESVHIIDILTRKGEIYVSTTMSGILISSMQDLIKNITNFPKDGDVVGTILNQSNKLYCGNSSYGINRININEVNPEISYKKLKYSPTTFIAHLESLDENYAWAIYWDKFKLDIIHLPTITALNKKFPIDSIAIEHKSSFKVSLPTKDAIPIIKKINETTWLYAVNNQLYKISGSVEKGLHFTFLDSISSPAYITSIDLVENEIFIGNSSLQVYTLKGTDLKRLVNENNPNIPVRYFLKDQTGQYYLLSTNGIYIYSSTFQRIDQLSIETNKIDGNIIYSGYVSKKNVLWAATNKGIIAFDCKNRNIFRLSSLGFIKNIEYNTKSIAVDNNETIYFGGSKGITVVNTTKLSPKKRNFELFFYEIKNQGTIIHNRMLPGSIVETKDFAYSKNSFQFSVHAISTLQKEPFELRYKLEGIDSTWRNGTAAPIIFNSLKPGFYRFVLSGKYPDSNESNEISYSFTIAPPFWKKTWFISIVSLIVLILIFLLNNYWYRRKIEKEKISSARLTALRNERERISQELHDDLGTGLTSIKLLSKTVLSQPDPTKNNKMLQDISKISEELIDQMGEIIWVLNHSDDTIDGLLSHLRIYMASYLQRTNLPIRLEFHHTPESNIPISSTERRNILLVIKEAFHNTVKHANASNFSVHISKPSKMRLKIVIADNGTGIITNSKTTGNGLKNISKRIQSINGTIEWFNENGTRIQITI
jgi:signal transduction histidine kinase